jgi:hypothetical protein
MKILAFPSISAWIGLADHSYSPKDISVFLPGYYEEKSHDTAGDYLIAPDRPPLEPTRRLVVLIPEGDVDEGMLARKVARLAAAAALQLLFLGLSPDHESLPYLRRRLARLATLTAQGQGRASSNVIIGENWYQAANEVLRAGDLLVCFARHQVSFRIFGRRRLGELLSTSLSVPVLLLDGLHVGPSPYQWKWIQESFAWFVSIVLMGAFAGIQMWIERVSVTPSSTILLCLSVLIECLLIFKVNEWIG